MQCTRDGRRAAPGRTRILIRSSVWLGANPSPGIAHALSGANYSHMDYHEQYKLKSADPKYQEYTAKIRDAVQEKNRTNAKQCKLLREINNLSASLDLTRHKSWDFEGVEESKDKVLEEFTGDDGESWFWTYHNAGEEIEKIMIQKCIKVANLAVQWDVLTERIAKLNKDQDKYGDKVVAAALKEASK